ncbi:MAG: ParB N-terminal domain-containing protein [Rhodanobacteraceae bacterium]|nr:ParB N-terminal domain-containing protein [Rhodanobacteraceae bacterium]
MSALDQKDRKRQMDGPGTKKMKVDELRIDLRNPRAGAQVFQDENEAIRNLIDHADVRELVTSITAAGWIEYEPLIVERSTSTVLEGNRRLAALRLLRDNTLRSRFGFEISEAIPQLPEEINVLLVNSREDARAYIAFKHINGPAKWDALAKAKYAHEWMLQGYDVRQVSRSIGDTHNTVLRLVNGYRVFVQSVAQGFSIDDITARRFNFSHIYTAVARPSVRSYLGLPEDPSGLLIENPVPSSKEDELEDFMGWLYGQSSRGKENVVKSQNPDLGLLARVVGNERALHHLISTRNLRAASEIIVPEWHRFSDALRTTAVNAETTLGLISHFNPTEQAGLQDTVRALANTVKIIRDQMIAKLTGGDDL